MCKQFLFTTQQFDADKDTLFASLYLKRVPKIVENSNRLLRPNIAKHCLFNF